MNKVNQLSAQERFDVFRLLEILRRQPTSEPEVVHILPRQFQEGYLDVWGQATGGKVRELARFFRGSSSHLSLPRATLVNLHSDSSFLIFAIRFVQDVLLDEPVRSDVTETFYVTQGQVELVLSLHNGDFRFQLCAGSVSQVCPGKPYRLFAELGTHLIVVHQPSGKQSGWGLWLGTQELTGPHPPVRVKRRGSHEGGRSGTA